MVASDVMVGHAQMRRLLPTGFDGFAHIALDLTFDRSGHAFVEVRARVCLHSWLAGWSPVAA
jgi:hypothetical protein